MSLKRGTTRADPLTRPRHSSHSGSGASVLELCDQQLFPLCSFHMKKIMTAWYVHRTRKSGRESDASMRAGTGGGESHRSSVSLSTNTGGNHAASLCAPHVPPHAVVRCDASLQGAPAARCRSSWLREEMWRDASADGAPTTRCRSASLPPQMVSRSTSRSLALSLCVRACVRVFLSLVVSF